MNDLAVIGGSGLMELEGLEIVRRETVDTPWGPPSAPLSHGRLEGIAIMFLARHGVPHAIPPHRVNYRANIWALHHAGARRIIAVAAVGGIRSGFDSGVIVVPDQIVDYTWGRAHTFFEDDLDHVVHVDFTSPYCERLRAGLLDAARRAGVDAADGGTYATTQGPRLESAAEIDRLERDGCDIVGMTGMPEATLARELGMRYAHCAVVSNRAAGRSAEALTMDMIRANLESGVARAQRLLAEFVSGG
ncbi:MAG: S-methyl-5'-thioinosine phosphorylase [Gammaproteobacteria bacterium]|nr:S-methyl-5'-thioinosine phosphorylase [Gammaproteobacteria bacterium]